MTGRYERYRHEVDVWTVGQLRESLDGVSDDVPVHVWVREDIDEEWVINHVATGACSDGECFDIDTDFPPGVYERWVT